MARMRIARGGKTMYNELKEKILKIIEKNNKLTDEEVAVMLGVATEEVAVAVKELEADKIICGYHTLINWDKTGDDEVSAIIELRVNPQRGSGFDRIAEKVYQFPEVETVFLMSGGFDFMVQLKKAPMKEIALFVAKRLSVIDEVQSTTTHFVLKRYKDHGTLFVDEDEDKRMVLTP